MRVRGGEFFFTDSPMPNAQRAEFSASEQQSSPLAILTRDKKWSLDIKWFSLKYRNAHIIMGMNKYLAYY